MTATSVTTHTDRPRLRVLIVDDDIAVADLHERFVSAHPSCVVVGRAYSGPEALEAVAAHKPDLVLLDFYLPGLSGLDVLRDLRAAGGPQPEVIAVTAARDVDSVRRARSAGVRHYLVKPFTPADLRARLDDIVRDSRLLAGPSGWESLDQGDIDVLMTTGTRPAPILPKGLSIETLTTVARALQQAPNSSASEIGAIAGISRVSSRRYLEHLVAGRKAARSLDYGSTGRPSTRYLLTQRDPEDPHEQKG